MRVGYIRVSTIDQNKSMQVDALEAAGCEKIFSDSVSGATADRPGLDELIKFVRSGDCVVVWKVDRLGRSLKDLLEIIDGLKEKNVSFVSITDGFDTNTTTGNLFFQIMAVLAEYERNLIRERTRAGLDAARARGRTGGRKKKLSTDQVSTLKKMYESKEHSLREICDLFNISKPTLYRYVEE